MIGSLMPWKRAMSQWVHLWTMRVTQFLADLESLDLTSKDLAQCRWPISTSLAFGVPNRHFMKFHEIPRIVQWISAELPFSAAEARGQKSQLSGLALGTSRPVWPGLKAGQMRLGWAGSPMELWNYWGQFYPWKWPERKKKCQLKIHVPSQSWKETTQFSAICMRRVWHLRKVQNLLEAR